jgi:hypothetical protein
MEELDPGPWLPPTATKGEPDPAPSTAGQQQEQPPPPPGSPLHRLGQQADPDLATSRLSSASAGGDEGGIDAVTGSLPSAAASLARWVLPPLPYPSRTS